MYETISIPGFEPSPQKIKLSSSFSAAGVNLIILEGQVASFLRIYSPAANPAPKKQREFQLSGKEEELQ